MTEASNDNGTVQESTVRILAAHEKALKAGQAAFNAALDCESDVGSLEVLAEPWTSVRRKAGGGAGSLPRTRLRRIPC